MKWTVQRAMSRTRPHHSALRSQQLLHPLHILGTHLGRWRRLLIIQREVIPGTVIDVVHEAIQRHHRFSIAGLQWDGNIRDRIAYGEQIHRRLRPVVRTAHENAVIALDVVILHPKWEWFSGA